GNEFNITGSGGLRNIKENTAITNLTKDASGAEFNFSSLYDTLKLKTYLLRLKVAAAHYFQLGKLSTLKAAVNSGWLQTENPFKNEVYQIGGYRLLRGFDEESIYATGYVVSTIEYRYLVGLNSYFFGFVDGGWARNNSFAVLEQHT